MARHQPDKHQWNTAQNLHHFGSLSLISNVHTIKKAHKLPNIIPFYNHHTTDSILYNLLLHNFAFEPKIYKKNYNNKILKKLNNRKKKYNTEKIYSHQNLVKHYQFISRSRLGRISGDLLSAQQKIFCINK